MSVVIISNNKLSNDIPSLGNINGLKANQDWVLFLDFERDKLYKKIGNVQSEISLNQAVIAEHDFQMGEYATPKTMFRNGEMQDVQSNNELRYWLSPRGKFGLLIEQQSTNILVDPFNPISRTATLPVSTAFMASVVGSGSMLITGDNIQGSPITVTESAPVRIKTINTAITSPVYVTANNLQHYQIEIYSGFAIPSTPIGVGTTARTRKGDIVKINPTLLAEIQLENNYTIIMQQDIAYDRSGNATSANSNETRLVAKTNTHEVTIGVNRNGTEKTGQTRSVRMTSNLLSGVSDGAATGTLLANDDLIENFVYKFSDSEFKGFGNNSNTPSILSKATGTQVSDIYLRSGKFIITKLVVYKRALTDAEILKAISSWL
ncbi:hypothetical protein ABLT80_08995 [Acinetobacter schindleri]|uniref:hypothetical protein n=1 Tax=Acinetobacter schindleri TaxID=108981 RepID=UPI0032B476EA